MKVCIDGLGLNMLEGTGLYTYSYSLIRSLIQYHPQSNYHIIWDTSSENMNNWGKSMHLGKIEVDRINNDYSNIENYLRDNKIKIYHSPNNGFSISKNMPSNKVITVHDLIALSDIKYVDEKYKNKFLNTFPSAVKWADKIIAVSDFIKNQIIDYYNVYKDKIEVIYPICSIDNLNIKDSEIKKILANNYHITDDFILFAGSIHPRKNLKTLMFIFKDILYENSALKLVIAGKIDGKRTVYYNELRELGERLNISDSIIFTDIVPLRDMYLFYKQCKCFINISEYEGFPITVMEALMFNAPVICSDIPAMREAAESKAVFVNPKDSDQIKAAVMSTIYNELPKAESIEYIRKFDTTTQINKLVRLYEEFM